MVTKIQKWGNSQGLRLSKELLSNADIDVGDEVEVVVHKGTLVVTPLRRVRGGHDLRELVGCISKEYRPEELEAKRIGRAPVQVLEEALSILDACIY
ncbi:MAG: AbrB/MazE/SpoVT family DNA-binding domain-containing protein [Acidobacteriota bacterium]